jgi:hypothetical protein
LRRAGGGIRCRATQATNATNRRPDRPPTEHLRVESPDELIGRQYTFPQTPDDDPPDWPHLFEHDWAYPMRVAFTAKRDWQYRVEIAGGYPVGGEIYDLRVEAWLDWQE